MLLKLRIGFLLKFLEIQRGMMFYAAMNVCKIKWGIRWWSGGPNVKKKHNLLPAISVPEIQLQLLMIKDSHHQYIFIEVT